MLIRLRQWAFQLPWLIILQFFLWELFHLFWLWMLHIIYRSTIIFTNIRVIEHCGVGVETPLWCLVSFSNIRQYRTRNILLSLWLLACTVPIFWPQSARDHWPLRCSALYLFRKSSIAFVQQSYWRNYKWISFERWGCKEKGRWDLSGRAILFVRVWGKLRRKSSWL